MLDHLSRIARIGNKIVSVLAITVALLMLVFAGYALIDTYYIERMAFSTWDLTQYKPVSDDGTFSRERFDELKAINPDVVGWITIYDTNIDYPILQGPDDLYYVNRDIYGDSTLSGSIYLQSANSPDFTDSFNLLYGHHFENGAMFGDLSKYHDQEFLETHRKGELVTEYGVYSLDIFACLETTAYDENIYGVTEIEKPDLKPTHRLVHVPDDHDPSEDIVDADPFLKGHNDVLALSTCDDAMTDGRSVVVADVTDTGMTHAGTDDTDNSSKGGRVASTGEIRPYDGKWAFLNLLCMIFTILCIVPFIVKFIAKKDKNDPRIRLLIGTALCMIAAIASVILFIITEDMHRPLTLRDQFTPFMILIFAGALLITSLSERYRERSK